MTNKPKFVNLKCKRKMNFNFKIIHMKFLHIKKIIAIIYGRKLGVETTRCQNYVVFGILICITRLRIKPEMSCRLDPTQEKPTERNREREREREFFFSRSVSSEIFCPASPPRYCLSFSCFVPLSSVELLMLMLYFSC